MCLVPFYAATARIILKLFQMQENNFWEPSASYLIGPHWKIGDTLWSMLFAFITLPVSFVRCEEIYQTRL